MKLDGDQDQYRSFFGSILSIFLLCIMLVFTITKWQVLTGRDDIDILTVERESWFKDSDRFSYAENDFYVAAAITEYDSNTESIEDESYGRLVFEHYGWGSDDGVIGLNTDKIVV